MTKLETSIELDNPLSSVKIAATTGYVKVGFFNKGNLNKDIPTVDINDQLRTVICNSKVKINPYNISKKNGQFEIVLPENIRGSLANLIIVKTLTNVGLKYKCDSCKLQVDGTEKTICFHY
tara:strand:- start:230 stop:592 length:363 start_codon:yes stop_codon:yes gene_type:complete